MAGLSIQINRDTAIIRSNAARAVYTLQTENAFGILYSSLETHFPNFDSFDVALNIKNHMRNKLAPQKQRTEVSYKLLRCTELGGTLQFFREYFEEKSVVLSVQEVDKMRIKCAMRSNYLPVSIADTESMEFSDLTTVTQVMVALLYFYAYFGYKLVKCRHCGRWFATHSLKNQYCKQVSPCCGEILKSEQKSCEQAVRQITQNCTRLRNAIRTKAGRTINAQLHESSFLQKFEIDNFALEQAAREAPTVENLTAYYVFLRKVNKSRGWTGGAEHGKHYEAGQ